MTIRELLAASGSGAKVIDRQVFTASGTWTKPAGVLDTDIVRVDEWGGGGSGGISSSTDSFYTGNGGGGGAHNVFELLASELNATEPVIVGAGGAAVSTSSSSSANGNDGGYSEFKGRRAYGGTKGAGQPPASGGAGGLGGGIYSSGNLVGSGRGGEPQILAPYNDQGIFNASSIPFRWAPGEWGGGCNFLNFGVDIAQNTPIHGGGGCISSASRSVRSSVWGGGAGGVFQNGTAVGNGTELGGLSSHGGNGGDAGIPASVGSNANGINGQPRGGGGGGAKRGGAGTATSGAGGRGEVVITVIRR